MSVSLPAAYRRLHADARAYLLTWPAPSTGQERLRQQLLAHLEAHPDALWRDGPAAHLTVSALVLDRDGERVLLTLHRKARAWFQLGGHCEPQDTGVHAAATREAREESGIEDLVLHPTLVDLDRHALAGSFGRCREHLDLRFVAVAPEGALPIVSVESLDLRWWPVDALPDGCGADLPRLIESARRQLSSVAASPSAAASSSSSESPRPATAATPSR